MATPKFLSFLGIARESVSKTVTSATSTGTQVDYTMALQADLPVVGQTVNITGNSAASLNLTNQIVTAITASSPWKFTVVNSVAATTGTGGTAVYTTRAGGTAPTAVAASDWIPVTDLKPFDNIKYLDDVNWRGAMVKDYNTVQGNIYSEIELAGDVFPDTIPWVFAGVLGDAAITGISAPYSHTVSTKNNGTGQAASYSFTDYNGFNARQYTGCQFGSIDLKFSAEGLLEYTATAHGWKSGTVTKPTQSFGSLPPLPVWTGTTTIGGTVVKRLADGNLKIERPLTPIFTVDNDQNPYQMFQGAVEVTGSLKLVYEDDTDLAQYLNNSQPSLDIEWTTGTSTALVSVKVTMTKCAFQVAKIDRSKDYVELDVTFRGLANTTDVGTTAGYSPIKVVVKNAVSTAKFG